MMLFIEKGTPCRIEFDDDNLGILVIDTITQQSMIIDRNLVWSTAIHAQSKDVFAFGWHDGLRISYNTILIIEKKYFTKL